MDQYAFQYDGDTLLVPARDEQMARCRAFHEVCVSYDVDPDRLQQIEWPSDEDYVGPLGDEPAILEGG